MNNCRVYIRKSTNNYQEHSLDTQLSRIKEYCNLHKFNIVKVYQDICSGSSIELREDFKLMMKEFKPRETLICYSLSRLSRSINDVLNIFEELEKRNIKFISISEQIDSNSYFGKFQINLLASISTLELDMLSSRISDSMQLLSQQGKLAKKPSFGWKVIEKKEPRQKDEEEQKIIELIKKLYEEDKMNFTKIGQYLDEKGIKLRKSKKAYQNIIKNILINNKVKLR